MNGKNKTAVVLILIFFTLSIFSSCATNRERGAIIGGTAGALLGAAAFGSHSWQAALIGGVGGAIIGGLIGDSIDAQEERQAKVEAAQTNQKVIYYTDDKSQAVESTPIARNEQTRCTKVRTKTYKNGEVIKDVIEEVCRGEKTTDTY